MKPCIHLGAMIIMVQTKQGFSLIETLVAITIASISVLALMQVVSRSSNTSANLLQRFDSSLAMGLIAADINESLLINTVNAYDLLSTRYDIDHPMIRDTLKQTSYNVMFSPKEIIDPLMSTNINTIGSSAIIHPFGIQKVILHNSEEKKSFFRLTTGS